jgi:hypothetical protein
MNNLKFFIISFLVFILIQPLFSQTIPNSMIGCWYAGIKINPKSEYAYLRYPDPYFELTNTSFYTVKLDSNGIETKRENCGFKVENKTIFFVSNDIEYYDKGVVYYLNFDNIKNPYMGDNRSNLSELLYRYTCPVKSIENYERCPDNINIIDNQFHGTARKYKAKDSHYYYEVILWVNLTSIQKKYITSLKYSADVVSKLDQVRKPIAEKMIIKGVLEGTRFVVYPEYKCRLNNLKTSAVIYFRDLKQIK